MPKKVFISFRYEDEFKVWSFRNLAEFKNVPFEMDDVSLRKAVNSKDDTYIRSVIRDRIRDCDVCLCLIGETTYLSRKWVPWEVSIAADEGKEIFGMRFKGTPNAPTPKVLTDLGIRPLDWDLDKLLAKFR
jgi:hypothetical protein